jgi:hypothetical protein
MSDLDRYLTDEAVEKAAQALHDQLSMECGALHAVGQPLGDTIYDNERRTDARAALTAAAPLIAAKALEAAADDLDLEDAAKTSGLNNIDFDWDGHYWEAVAEHALRACAAKLYPS